MRADGCKWLDLQCLQSGTSSPLLVLNQCMHACKQASKPASHQQRDHAVQRGPAALNTGWHLLTACPSCDGCAPGVVTQFKEKPSGATLEAMAHATPTATSEAPFEASMGVYVFGRDVLVSLLGPPSLDNTDSGAHFGLDIIPKALRDDYRVCSHHFDGYFRVSLCLLQWRIAGFQLSARAWVRSIRCMAVMQAA